MHSDKSTGYESVPTTPQDDLEAVNFSHVTSNSIGSYTPRYTARLALQTSAYITGALVVADRLISVYCNDDGSYPLQNPNVQTVAMRWMCMFVGQFCVMRSFVQLKARYPAYLWACFFALAGLFFTMTAILVQFQEL
ncbi:hypothetical protein CJU89_4075 [Yarrowia sp. B02]|nr:hypothetical protein CJU89_4075 [Yarrowia sp. B02]